MADEFLDDNSPTIDLPEFSYTPANKISKKTTKKPRKLLKNHLEIVNDNNGYCNITIASTPITNKKLTVMQKTKLIDCVKNEPAIWDLKNDLYCNNLAIGKAWRAISSEMELPETICKANWRSLRTSRNYHAKKKLKKSGAGNEEPVDDDDNDESVEFETETVNKENNSDPWEFETELSFLTSSAEKRKTFISNDAPASSFGTYNYANSTTKPKEKSDVPDFFKNFFNKMENKWEKRSSIKEPKAINSFDQFKNKEMLVNIGQLLEPLSPDVVLNLNIQILGLIQAARAAETNQ